MERTGSIEDKDEKDSFLESDSTNTRSFMPVKICENVASKTGQIRVDVKSDFAKPVLLVENVENIISESRKFQNEVLEKDPSGNEKIINEQTFAKKQEVKDVDDNVCKSNYFSKFGTAKIKSVDKNDNNLTDDSTRKITRSQSCQLGEQQSSNFVASSLPKMAIRSYSFVIASSLCHLFTNGRDNRLKEKYIKVYMIENRGYRKEYMKHFLIHIDADSEHLTPEIMLVNGEVECDPPENFLEDILKSPIIQEHGAKIIIKDLLVFSLENGKYDARSRTLVKYVCSLLGGTSELTEKLEDDVQKFFCQAHMQSEEELKEKEERANKRKYFKIAAIGLASIGGGALIGLTAGLAAPFVAGSLGLISGTVGTALFATKAGVAIVGSLFGLAGAGLTGRKMKKRVGELEEFEFEELTPGKSLNITIAVSGWLNDKYSDFRKMWMGLDCSTEQYVLRYEAKYLRELGEALKGLADVGVSLAISEGLKHTVLNGLISSIMWPMALLSASQIIDNPWGVCAERSLAAGRQLAEVLLAREHGQRPVTLIGFGFGARVVFSCLLEMSERKNCEGVVEEAIMLGSPVTGSSEVWKKFKKVVSGRVVNGYCSRDWMLKFMYRTASMQLSVAGLSPIDWSDRIMQNVDLSSVIENHFDYMEKIDDVLKLVGVTVKDHVPVKCVSSLAAWTEKKFNALELKTDEQKDIQMTGEQKNIKKTDEQKDIQKIDEQKDIEKTGEQKDIQKTDEQKDIQMTGEQKDIQKTGEQKDIQMTGEQKGIQKTDEQEDIEKTDEQKDIQKTDEQKDILMTGEQKDIKKTGEQKDIQMTGEQKDIEKTGEQKDIEMTGKQKDIQKIDEQKDVQKTDEQKDIQKIDEQKDIQKIDEQKDIQKIDEQKDIQKIDEQKDIQKIDEQKDIQKTDEQKDIQK